MVNDLRLHHVEKVLEIDVKINVVLTKSSQMYAMSKTYKTNVF